MMNKSSLHLKLIKLYLMYFESGNKFDDDNNRQAYLRTTRYLKEIEKIAKQRRAEIKEIYTSTDHYKNVTAPSIKKKITALRSKYQSRKIEKN